MSEIDNNIEQASKNLDHIYDQRQLLNDNQKGWLRAARNNLRKIKNDRRSDKLARESIQEMF